MFTSDILLVGSYINADLRFEKPNSKESDVYWTFCSKYKENGNVFDFLERHVRDYRKLKILNVEIVGLVWGKRDPIVPWRTGLCTLTSVQLRLVKSYVALKANNEYLTYQVTEPSKYADPCPFWPEGKRISGVQDGCTPVSSSLSGDNVALWKCTKNIKDHARSTVTVPVPCDICVNDNLIFSHWGATLPCLHWSEGVVSKAHLIFRLLQCHREFWT